MGEEPEDLYDQLRDLIRPLMIDVHHRKVRLRRAFDGYPGLLDRITVDGETGVFLSHLLQTLRDCGELGPGRSAVALLLEAIRGDVGAGGQRTIDSIFQGLREGTWHDMAGPLVEEVLGYLDGLANQAADLPKYFPAHLRQAGKTGNPFDAIRQTVQVVEDRPAWDRWRADERERGVGLEDDRNAYAPERARPKDRLMEDKDVDPRNDRREPSPPIYWDEHVAGSFPRAIILGDPGFGKTWLLRYEARRLARDAARLLRDDANNLGGLILPLLGRLFDLNCSDGPLEEALIEAIEVQEKSAGFCRLVRECLATGRAVVLLDAWDEVRIEVPSPGQPIGYEPHHRQRLGQRLGYFVRRFSRCRLLLTSRIVGYEGSPIPDSHELELFAFEWPQIESFTRMYFNQDDDAEQFLKLLRQTPQVRGLARIPLMLTLMCRAYQKQDGHRTTPADRSDFPTRRVDIYRICIRGLLRDWKEEKERRTIGDAYVEAVLEVLMPAAYALFAGGNEQFGEGLLRETLRTPLRALEANHELSARDATSLIAELKHSGLLITTGERNDAPLVFLHRTFHEYLVAAALVLRAKKEGWKAISALVDRKSWRPAWHQVLVLLSGQLADPDSLLRLLADKRRDDLFRHRLALAALCLIGLSPF